MLACVLDDEGCVRVCERPRPERRPWEVLVKVHLAGICNTDLELMRGYKGGRFRGVLGHEFVGTVEEIEPTATRCRDVVFPSWLRCGIRVVGEINCVDPEVSESRSAHERAQDRNRSAMGIFGRDGAFAEYVTVPVVNLHPVPDGVDDEKAVFVEPLAAACNILEQVHMKPSDEICVLGAGKLGLLIVQVVLTTGANVVLASRSGNVKLNDRLTRSPALQIISVDNLASSDQKFDVVVEATGSALGLETAITLTRPRGTIVLKSTVAEKIVADLSTLVVNEIRVVGSRCGPFQVALRLLQAGSVDTTFLVSGMFELENAVDALYQASRPGARKVLLRMQ